MAQNHTFNCDTCGQFIPYSHLQMGGGGSNCFVPDSDVSQEENVFRCRPCTEKHGAPLPNQSGMDPSVTSHIF